MHGTMNLKFVFAASGFMPTWCPAIAKAEWALSAMLISIVVSF
jgi:hypothetical protein